LLRSMPVRQWSKSHKELQAPAPDDHQSSNLYRCGRKSSDSLISQRGRNQDY
jgi:hypothetical protein